MKEKCSGYWETCNCEDCKKAKELYSNLDYYQSEKEEFKHEIKEIEKELNNMGYSF